MTREQITVAISRLSSKINSELKGQEACDKLEAEMIKLQSDLEALTNHKE